MRIVNSNKSCKAQCFFPFCFYNEIVSGFIIFCFFKPFFLDIATVFNMECIGIIFSGNVCQMGSIGTISSTYHDHDISSFG